MECSPLLSGASVTVNTFIYPRTVSVYRQTARTGIGLVNYGGETPATEAVVVSGLPASIQHVREKGTPEGKVPADAPLRSGWNFFIPSNDRTLITERDVLVDDIGKRYIVTAAYWNSLGYVARAELLET